MTPSPYKVVVTNGDKEVFKTSLPRVTTILDTAFGGDGLARWTYNHTVAGFSILLGKYGGTLPSDIPSLHSILSQENLAPTQHRDKAATIGERYHTVLHRLASGRVVSVRPHEERLQGWFAESIGTKDRVLATEATVFSLSHLYAGTLDLVWIDSDAKVVMTDLKTGSLFIPKIRCQLAAYGQAWAEMGGQPIDRYSILACHRDSDTVEEVEVTPDPQEWQAALAIYRATKRKD